MPSTYSSNLKLELMATGENSGTWGNITNTNLGTAAEQAIVGYGSVVYASDANLTISITNSNAAQAARALVLNVTSSLSLTGTRELVVPTIEKQYIVQNNTTGAQSITVKTSAGTGITVPNGRKAHLYVDGTNVIQMFDFVDINGGTIDGAAIGGSSASTGAFTTLSASGAATFNGAVTLGDAAADLIVFNGTVNSHLLFTDNTYDIGASGATRPRNLFLAGAATIGGNLSVGGTLTLTGGLILNGNVTVGDSSADTLTVNATITSNLLFTDNTYDIGASGATRPRNLFLAGNATIGGNTTMTGTLTVDSTTDSSSTTTGSIQTDGGVGIAKKLFVGLDANIYGITVGRGAGAVAGNIAVGANALSTNSTGSGNTAVGASALYVNSTGEKNTAVGTLAGYNGNGSSNTMIGYYAAYSVGNASGVTAIGAQALYIGGGTPTNSTAVGGAALYYTSGANNTGVGHYAMLFNTTGTSNTALGKDALYSNTTASNNTAVGCQAAFSNTTGTEIHAFGFGALYSNTTGAGNAAFGMNALRSNTTGSGNAAFGNQQTGITNSTMYNNTTGSNNSAFGVGALRDSSTSSSNTAIGYFALLSNTAGENTAVGANAMQSNTTGTYNVSLGKSAGSGNTTGNSNISIGWNANRTGTGSGNTLVGTASGYDATSGTQNTSLGDVALRYITSGSYNTAVGGGALNLVATASYNTSVGYQAGYANTTANYATYLGAGAGLDVTTGAGNCFVGAFTGQNVTTGSANTFVGGLVVGTSNGCGSDMTTGSKNTILGGYTGNQGGLDIRTASNYIVLSDGDGNPRVVSNGSGKVGISAGPYTYAQVTANSATDSVTYRVMDQNNNESASTARYTALAYYARRDNNVRDSAPLTAYGSTAAIVFTDRPGTGNYANAVRTSDIEFWTASNTGGGGLDAQPNKVVAITAEQVVNLLYGQIQFPATQNASSNANTLDDYEEGTWTPTVGDGTTTVSIGGTYLKIGKYVYVGVDGYNTNYSALSTTGHLRIGSLPFTVGSAAHAALATNNTGGNTAVLEASGTTAFLYTSNGAIDWIQATRNSLVGGASTFSIRFQFMYIANA